MTNTLIGSIQTTQTQAANTAQSISAQKTQFSACRNEATTFATDTSITHLENEINKLQLANGPNQKLTSLEQDVKDLQLALPATKKSFSRPNITDVSTIVIPIQPAYELKSKTVKLNFLHNSLMALTFTSDKISAIKHMYARIRQAIDIGCNTSSLLPDIENEVDVPDFFDILVPPQTDNFYMPVLASYKPVSDALLTFFHRPETVTSSAPGVSQAIKEVESSSDGFIHLGTILHQLLPQFAGKPLSSIDELSTLFIANGEEYKNFHTRALEMQSKLTLSKITMPPTMFFEHYLSQLNKCDGMRTFLAKYNRKYAKHLREKGDAVPFHESIGDVYTYLTERRYPTTLTVQHTHITPTANLGSSNPVECELCSTFIPTANAANYNRKICDLCDKKHDVDDCHIRGTAFMPPALAKKVERYNEIHENAPKVPKKDRLQKPFQPRHTTVAHTAKMVQSSIPPPDTPPITDPDKEITQDLSPTIVLPPPTQPDHNVKIVPSGGMAELNDVGKDYMDFLFPSGGVASIDIIKHSLSPPNTNIPPNFIDFIQPTANIANSKIPLNSTTTTYAENDEIFTHKILENYTKILKTFQADWGANIMIVNDKDLYTEFVPCNASLNPIHGNPIHGIKGYGTIIFCIGSRLVHVQDCAYMPKNPQCTFSTSHLQQLNGYLPGIHAMHSSIKIVNPESISTKFTPTIINALDYIDIEVIIKGAYSTATSTPSILPTANSAKVLSAQLIHQKCGHFDHQRITELAKRKLIDGLPTNIPQLSHTCPICLKTKANHHPRRPPTGYTLLKPGHQIHMNFSFVSVTSIRGFTAILYIKCAHTRKARCFPCPNKRSTLDIITFFIRFLEKDGIYILEIRVDEDGALANSADFCKLLHTNGISIQSTGGYSSDLKGNVEIFNKTLKRGTGALLANAGLKEIFWCYASIYYCNLHNYLSFNHDKTLTAFEAWYGKRPHWHIFRTFGCDVYVVNENTIKNNLTKATKHTFLRWGVSTSTIHYLDSENDEIKRAHHVYFDDYSSSTAEKDLSPGALLIRNENITLPSINEDILNFQYNISPDPFLHNNVTEHTVDLTLLPHFPYGVDITFDEHFGIPFIKTIHDSSPWYMNLPGNFRRNIWILAINTSEPITPTETYEAIEFHIKNNIIIKVILSKWEPTTRTKLDTYRSQFDQVRSTRHHTVPPASPDNKENIPPIAPQGNFAIFAPTKPTAPEHKGELLKSDLKIEWKKSLWEGYDKNAKIGIFTAPFPIEDIPKNKKVLNSRVTFKVKNMDADNMYDLYSHHCANGNIQIQGKFMLNQTLVTVKITVDWIYMYQITIRI